MQAISVEPIRNSVITAKVTRKSTGLLVEREPGTCWSSMLFQEIETLNFGNNVKLRKLKY